MVEIELIEQFKFVHNKYQNLRIRLGWHLLIIFMLPKDINFKNVIDNKNYCKSQSYNKHSQLPELVITFVLL